MRGMVCLLLAMSFPCLAAPGEEAPHCANLPEDGARLKCYDEIHATQAPAVSRSYLTRTWDLDGRDDELLGEEQSPLRPHHVSYLIARRSSGPNTQPFSPTHPAPGSTLEIDNTELKFQISQKGKVLNALRTHAFGIVGMRLWGAYTQQSNWQAFNSGNSSPFRETNYEPELILTLNTGNQYGLKLINLGWVHQSNGRDLGGSRSWNRTYVQGGWENDTFSAMLRGWWRVQENLADDDNPDISDYAGRADIHIRWEPLDHSQVLVLTLRNNLSSDTNRGFIQLDWATPVTVSKSTKLHIQFTSGFGESLIDYNVSQTTLGVGVSFRDW